MTGTNTAGEREEQRSANAIRCLSIPLVGSTLLLPYTAVAEVAEFGEPTRLTKRPGWLLGLLPWRGITVPMLALEELVGAAVDPSSSAPEKVVVCNTLNGNPKLPFLAIAAAGIPRLLWVKRETLKEMARSEKREHPAILRHVNTPDGEVIIPDFDSLEQMLVRLGI